MLRKTSADIRTLLQVALLFIYISHAPPAVLKKRKREKKRSEPPSVADNPQAALEVLMDRLSVWSAISELESGPSTAENETQVMLQAFWTSVIRPKYVSPGQDAHVVLRPAFWRYNAISALRSTSKSSRLLWPSTRYRTRK